MYRKGSRYKGYFKDRGNWGKLWKEERYVNMSLISYVVITKPNLKWCSVTKFAEYGNTHLVKRLSNKDRECIKKNNNVDLLIEYVDEFEININKKGRKAVVLGDNTYIYDGKK